MVNQALPAGRPPADPIKTELGGEIRADGTWHGISVSPLSRDVQVHGSLLWDRTTAQPRC